MEPNDKTIPCPPPDETLEVEVPFIDRALPPDTLRDANVQMYMGDELLDLASDDFDEL